MIARRTTDDMAGNSNAMLGLSGLDTATMLKAMMKPYKTSISALSQKQQTVVWRQERYRDLISKLNDFKTKFFDYRNPTTNIASAGTWKKFNVENPGSEYVKIVSTTSTKPKNGTIQLEKMPTGSSITGRSELLNDVVGSSTPQWNTAVGSYLTINMDGIVRNIAITSDFTITGTPTNGDHDVNAAKLQSALDAAFGVDRFTAEMVTVASNYVLKITSNPDKVNQFTIIDGSVSTARGELGFGGNSNLSNKFALNDTLRILSVRMKQPIAFKTITVTDGNGAPVNREVVEFSLNGVSFRFTEFDSIKSVMDTINNSGCGVQMTYDNRNDQFKLTATTGGPGSTINLSEPETNFFTAFGLAADTATIGAALNIMGGEINQNLVSMVNTANTLALANGEPTFAFNVTVNGVTKKIELSRDDYIDEPDMIFEINSKLLAAFPDNLIDIDVQPTGLPTDPWLLVLNIHNDAAVPPKVPVLTFSFELDPSSPSFPPGTGDPFGVTGLKKSLATVLPAYENGDFGRVVIDGVILQVDRQVFEYDGVLYELRNVPPSGSGPIRYSITTDTDKIVGLVRDFVDAYNEVIRSISTALGEKRDRDYSPLTDEQRDQLSEKEIANWEAKAKSGLLRGDTAFIGLSSKLRLSIFNPVYEKYGSQTSIPFSLKKMGIDTKDGLSSFNPADNGVLYIDEEVLRYAIETNLDQIAYLFTKEPQVFVPTAEDMDKPAAWHARMQRIYDDHTGGMSKKFMNILDDYIRTMRGANNAKGVLIEKAGVENDSSDLYNALTREILEYDKRINALWDRYDRIEKQKIRVLSRLESIISNAAAQVEWMQGQFGQQ